MIKYFFAILLTFIFQHVFSQSNDIAVLTKLNKEWLDAYVNKDKPIFNRIFAND